MQQDDIPFEPIHGPPAQTGGVKRWGFRRLPRAAVAGGVAVGLALGGAGIAFAASSSSSSTSTPSTTLPSTAPKPGHAAAGGRFGGSGGGRLGSVGDLGPVVHGQYTTRTRSGGYQTVDVQVGQVTAVSSTSITVVSTDGYTHTYVVASSTVVDAQRDGISSVSAKDQVQVQAIQSASTATATNIVDTTKVNGSRAGFGFGPGPGGARGGPSGSKGGDGSPPSTSSDTSAA